MKLISLKINKRGNSGWESDEIAFGAHVTQVTGENGSGKTPIIQAIVFCLGFPVTFRDDVKAQCRSISLLIEARNERHLIERMIEVDTKITVSSSNAFRDFGDEREFSSFVFSLIGLEPVNLLDSSNRKTVPYMATALPLFFLDQDNGYSDIYKPAAIFIKDQFQEMVRYLFRFSQKNLFESAKDLIALKAKRETLDEIIAGHRSVLERLYAKHTSNLSEEAITDRITEKKAQLDRLSSSQGARSDATAAYDNEIYELGKSITELDREDSELRLRASSFQRIKQEIDTEINTLSLNERARRLFESMESICTNGDCGLFKKSTEGYGKNLLYLKDQAKDLESGAEAAEARINVIREVRVSFQAQLERLKVKRERSLQQEGLAGLVEVIREVTESVIALEQELAVVRQLRSLTARLDEAEADRSALSDKIENISSHGRTADQNMVALRIELRALTLKWLEILGTENVDRNLQIDPDLKFQFGNEQIRAFKGSTLVRVVLAIHAALFEAYMARPGEKLSCLIFDTPNQQEIKTEDLRNFMRALKRLCADHDAQVVFASKDYRYEADNRDAVIEPPFPGLQHPMHLGTLPVHMVP
ncbi:MAG: hypothetical protein HYU78_14955 [Rhodocyclales bacterium]|nr:hypothetical protein [Rhodocyclales bacterium]